MTGFTGVLSWIFVSVFFRAVGLGLLVRFWEIRKSTTGALDPVLTGLVRMAEHTLGLGVHRTIVLRLTPPEATGRVETAHGIVELTEAMSE